MKKSLIITFVVIFSFAIVIFISKQLSTTENRSITYKKAKSITGSVVIHYPTTTAEKVIVAKTGKEATRQPASVKEAPTHIDYKLHEKIADSILSFHKEGTKVMIDDVEAQPAPTDAKNKFNRVFNITYIDPDGKPFSHTALIDTRNGLITEMWNQTRFENFRGKPEGIKHPWINGDHEDNQPLENP